MARGRAPRARRRARLRGPRGGGARPLAACARAPARRASGPRARPSTLTAAFAALAVVAGGIALARFQLVCDDFRFLVRARDNPWSWDESLRVLSTSCPFRLSVLLGPRGEASLLAANAAALLAAAIGWAAVVRRAGADRDTAALAAALFALAPGASVLLRRGSGLENLAGSACAILALAVLASAPPPGVARRLQRAAHLAALAAVTLLGVFVKYPFMAIVPPAAALLAIGLRRERPRAALALAGGLGAIVALPCALALGPAEARGLAASFGLARVGANLGAMAAALAPWVGAVASALAVLAASRVAREARGDGSPGALRRATARMVADARAALGGGRRALRGGRPRALRDLRGAHAREREVLPDLLRLPAHRGARRPRRAAAGPRRQRSGARPPGRRRSPSSRRLPWLDLRGASLTPAEDRVPAFLHEIAGVVAGAPEPDRLVLVPACGSAEESARSASDLATVFAAAGEQYGVRWVTGWRATDVVIQPPQIAPSPALRSRSRGPLLRRTAHGAGAARLRVAGAPPPLSAARAVLHDGGRMDLRSRARLLVCAASLAAALLLAPAARAACDDAARAWAARCSAGEGVAVAPELCLPGVLTVVATAPGGVPLRVEIDRAGRRGFARAGSAGVSPVGEFADWAAEPAPTHRAFDAVVACASRGLPEAASVSASAPAAVARAAAALAVVARGRRPRLRRAVRRPPPPPVAARARDGGRARRAGGAHLARPAIGLSRRVLPPQRAGPALGRLRARRSIGLRPRLPRALRAGRGRRRRPGSGARRRAVGGRGARPRPRLGDGPRLRRIAPRRVGARGPRRARPGGGQGRAHRGVLRDRGHAPLRVGRGARAGDARPARAILRLRRGRASRPASSRRRRCAYTR